MYLFIRPELKIKYVLLHLIYFNFER